MRKATFEALLLAILFTVSRNCLYALAQQPEEPSAFRCGCESCNQSVLNATAATGNTTCAEEIDYLRSLKGGNHTETEACLSVSETFADACAPCSCTANIQQDDNQTTPEQDKTYCGCTDCSATWNKDAGGATCGERIQQLQAQDAAIYDELNACLTISNFYPLVCGPSCHPQRCDGQGPKVCGCQTCTPEVLNRKAGNLTCRERISLQAVDDTERRACLSVTFFHPECGPECNPHQCDGQPLYCGCYDCTQEIWDKAVRAADDSATSTCGSRITFYESLQGGELKHQPACRRVAQDFPRECRPCHPEFCDEQVLPASYAISTTMFATTTAWTSWFIALVMEMFWTI